MTSTSLFRQAVGQIMPSNIREIDQAYHIEMIANKTEQIVDYQKQSLRLQAETSALNLQAYLKLVQQQESANHQLSVIAQEVHGTEIAIEYLTDVVDQGLSNINYCLNEGFNSIAHHIADLSQLILKQQQVLEGIAETIRRPFEIKVLELRNEADKWLKSGMMNDGRDQDEDWKDCARLLYATTDNPIGMQDYVAWFQIAWLLWKHEGKIAEAEQAFYRSQRLSAHAHDLYHLRALRHLAYMQYLQEKYEEAYHTIQNALILFEDMDVLYDAARYSAQINNIPESTSLLSKAIDIEPTVTIKMFSEKDFVPHLSDFMEMLFHKTMELRLRIRKRLQSGLSAISIIREIEPTMSLPPHFEQEVIFLSDQIEKAGYIELVDLEKRSNVVDQLIFFITGYLENRKNVTESELMQIMEEAKAAKNQMQQDLINAEHNKNNKKARLDSAEAKANNFVEKIYIKTRYAKVLNDLNYYYNSELQQIKNEFSIKEIIQKEKIKSKREELDSTKNA